MRAAQWKPSQSPREALCFRGVRPGGTVQAAAALLLLALLGALLSLAACSASAQDKGLYYCPMHPQVTADRPGDCSICGMHLVSQAPVSSGAASPATGKGRFVCPMHPEITAEGPADCSICGMHLIPRPVDPAGSPAGLAPVPLNPAAREQMGLAVEILRERPLGHAIRAPGRIVADETRVYRVIARIEGFVDQLFIPYAGLRVAKGQPLLGVNSPNLLSVQQQFLSASPSEGRRYAAPAGKPGPPGSEAPERGEDTQRQRLKYWDFSDEQIDRIQQTGKTENSLILVAPARGVVTEKTALLGQKVFPGDLLMVVTDLSRVWAEAEVPEMDAPSVRVGMQMVVRPTSMPGREFEGRVKFFQPVLDPQSHTLRVVVELANPDGSLKPGMVASAELRAEPHPGLAVPVGAVIRAGSADYAFVEESGRFVPRSVALGARSDGYFEVLSGLREGERVASSATFLLDSESSLQAALMAARTER